MNRYVPLIALLCLTGCKNLPGWMTHGARATPVAPAAPAVAPAPVATLEVHRAGPIEFFTGYDAKCEIHSIDGAAVMDTNYQLLPGNHTLTVTLNHLGRDYTGDVDLVIPEAKNYELKAKRKGDAFTLSIVDVDADKVIATSTAALNDHMKFLVFVVQK